MQNLLLLQSYLSLIQVPCTDAKGELKWLSLKKCIGWNNSRHCYSYCTLSCSLLSEWLCEIAMDVRGYFHNSLLTHILGCCFYGGLLLLAFNHLGCILLSLHSHHNKQSSQNRYIPLLNLVLPHILGRCGLMNSQRASIYSLWTATTSETFSVAPRACPGFFQSCVLLGYIGSQNPENRLFGEGFLTTL